VCCEHLRVAAEVEYIQAGERRISVPEHGYVLVVWTSAPAVLPSGRPRIVAVGRDGSVLTELGPEDYLDSLTLASLDDAASVQPRSCDNFLYGFKGAHGAPGRSGPGRFREHAAVRCGSS
jgi:hypothetical protein